MFFYVTAVRYQPCTGHYTVSHEYVTTCTGGATGIQGFLGVVAVVLVVVSPVLTGIYLAAQLRRGTARQTGVTDGEFSMSH